LTIEILTPSYSVFVASPYKNVPLGFKAYPFTVFVIEEAINGNFCKETEFDSQKTNNKKDVSTVFEAIQQKKDK
jgi:hypothetical protein